MAAASKNTSTRYSLLSYPTKNLTPDERVVTIFLTQTHLTLKDLINDWLENTNFNRSGVEQLIPAFLPICWQLARFLGLEHTVTSSLNKSFDQKTVELFEERTSESGKKTIQQSLNADSMTKENINKASPAFQNECHRLAEMFKVRGV